MKKRESPVWFDVIKLFLAIALLTFPFWIVYTSGCQRLHDQTAIMMGEYNAQQNIEQVNARLKAQAQEMRKDGATIAEISKKLKIPESWAAEWCNEIRR